MDKNDSKRGNGGGQRGGCPVLAFQRMVSGKYKIRILWDLKDGPRRYGEIRTGLLRGASGSREIAPRVLSRELRQLADEHSRDCWTDARHALQQVVLLAPDRACGKVCGE